MPDRAAIVTGASSGIGLAIADALGSRGYGLTIAARRLDKLAGAAEKLAEKGYDVQHVAGVLGDEEVVAEVVARHRDRFGRCDALINNAGTGIGEPIEDLTAKRMDMQIGINLRAVVFFTNACVDMLKEAGGEHGKALLVNISSIVAHHAQPELGIYCATKAAVTSFTASMHKELSRYGVVCSALCPGFVDTPMTDWAKEGVAKEKMIQPEDLAEAVELLLDVSPTCIIPEFKFIRRGRYTN